MTSTLSAKEQSLSKIFSDDYVFTIPDYQRPYSWGTEQARELMEDLLEYMQAAGGKLDELAPYFLGSIVLIKKEAVSGTTVVDGQQRLTTLTLLLSAIRANVADTDVRAGITKCIYEQGSVVFGTEARYRLSLRERDRDFFRQYVQHGDGIEKLVALNDKLPDAQQRLRENAQLYMAALAKLDQAVLVRLVQFIVTRCYLVTVATPDLDSAYRIFGVLNSRGLDLSATDILKAEIIGAIATARRSAYTAKWEDLEEDLGRDAFGDLFSHIRMAYRKAKPKSTLLKEFRDHVGPSDPVAFIDMVLEPMAQAFREITDADYSSQKHAESINHCLRWLNRIEFKDWLPPALAFFSRHRNDPAAMLAFFGDLERLAYSMLVRRSGVNERIERFAALTWAIEAQADLMGISSPLQLSRVEQYAMYTALSGPLYEIYSSRALAVILLRLDGLVSGGGATYDYDTITVEHVMPQQPRPDSCWLEWVPSPEDRLLWVHRLGNLALLTRKKNSSANNYDFDKKKTAYFTKGGVSPFALTTQVLQHAKWTLKVLEEREAQLLDVLETHWRLQDRQSPRSHAMSALADQKASGDSPVYEIKSQKQNLMATAREVDGNFVVLAGSQARSEWIGQYHSYQTLRQQLIDGGSLKPADDGSLHFIQGVSFSSPSAASAIVFGRPDNGRTSWIVQGTGHTYAEWEDGLPAGPGLDGDEDEQEPAANRQDLFRLFWTRFIERSLTRTQLFANRSTTADHWLSAGVGRTGFSLCVSLTQARGRAACFIGLPKDNGERSTQAFEVLRSQRAAIEESFGGVLDWQSLPGRVGARICSDVPGGWKLPEDQWPQLQDKLIDVIVRLDLALRDRIKDLDV
ncbi:DUF4268 domain-containing protein [Stenotrophomonas sp. YIM B06876]|uniref:DUF4268 domain-containing protein n=1 Tax=Stenotrophomonas sp. YIM B06876 TaxID=3060211 RepID=UPI00273A278D|nr:DUF4268 domain-containing protein [Stenotrophomonas sp. YIM B06876]